MTATMADGINIQEVTSRDSDSEGAYRQVFFVNDDLVVKVNYVDPDDSYGGHDSNADEFENYNRIKHLDNTLAVQDDIMFTVRIPKMEKVGDVIIAERIHHPHIDRCFSSLFRPCEHEECRVASAVERWSSRNLHLVDMHTGNFCWDADTRTAWIVDLGG